MSEKDKKKIISCNPSVWEHFLWQEKGEAILEEGISTALE